MTQSTRRPGFRLPWSGEGEPAPDGAPDAAEETTVESAPPTAPGETHVAEIDPTAKAAPAAEAATTEAATTEAATTEAAATTGAATPAAEKPASEPAAAPVTTSAEEPNDFLKSLVDAMRGVASEERTASVSELRTLVDEKVAQLETRAGERAEELRRKTELDVTGIGDWQKGEIERVNAEATRRIEARRKQLEQQLTDHETRSTAEVDSVRDRVAAYERELEAFFSQLEEVNDPASFVAAARRMPRPPSLEGGAAAAAKPASSAGATPTESLNARLAQLGIDRNGAAAASKPAATSEPAATPEAATEESEAKTDEPAEPRDAQLAGRLAELDARPEPATAVAPAPPSADEADEVATAIMLKGLASFGAITSFKQRLERLATVRAVTLSLGPTGEFVYRATHPRELDLTAAITTLEPGSTVERQADGSLRVTVQAR